MLYKLSKHWPRRERDTDADRIAKTRISVCDTRSRDIRSGLRRKQGNRNGRKPQLSRSRIMTQIQFLNHIPISGWKVRWFWKCPLFERLSSAFRATNLCACD